jgi:hypothetical protein
MLKTKLHSRKTTLATLLIGATALVGCAVEGDDIDDPLGLAAEEVDEIDEIAADPLAHLDPKMREAIALAPEIADEDVEALFAESEPTLRDVIRLFDPRSLPSDLSLDDLDTPMTFIPTEPPEDTIPHVPTGDFSAASTEPQLIGEQQCATTSIANPNNGASISLSPDPGCGFAWDGSTSPNASYDPTNCPDQYITDVSGTSGTGLQFYANWHGPSLNQNNCAFALMALSGYGGQWMVTWIGNTPYIYLQWTKIGTTFQHGVWSSGPWFAGCYWNYETGYGPLNLPSGHNYSRIRTAAHASFFFGTIKHRVEGGVRHGSGPC